LYGHEAPASVRVKSLFSLSPLLLLSQVLRDKLLYAITNCQVIDADNSMAARRLAASTGTQFA
jgi:hypothetical protein